MRTFMKNIKLDKIITIEAGKRQSKPCIRGSRITVQDVTGWLDAGMSVEEILDDFPELTQRDIQACIKFAKESNTRILKIQG